MSTAHILGRPEWASDDDEAADEYAASLRGIPEQEAAIKAADLRSDWAAAAGYYWAAAYAAFVDRDYRSMRENASVAERATEKASPSGVLLAAIFGGCETAPPERVVRLGLDLPANQVAEAMHLVRAEMARHAAAEAAKRAKPARTPVPLVRGETAQQVAAQAMAAANPMTLDAFEVAGHDTIAILAMVRKGMLVARRDGCYIYF